MVKGLKYWNDSSRYCDQTNNAIEKARKDSSPKGYLESCGVESIYTGMDCRGDIDKTGNPTWQGIDCQPSDFMFCHLNYHIYDKFYSGGTAMDNRSLKNMQKMLEKMGYFTELIKNPKPQDFKKRLPQNKPMIIHIPKHYCCAVAWDYLHSTLIFMNPWPGDPRNKNRGRHERLNIKDWAEIPISETLAFFK